MADSMSRTVDAMSQLVMAGEGGLMKATVAFENDKTLAATLAAAGEVPKGKPRVTGTRQGESSLITAPMVDISPGETRQGEPSDNQITLPPQPSKRPFESPLYHRGYKIETGLDIEKELGNTNKIVVQVNDVNINTWARSLVKRAGHVYFTSPNRARWFQGVNTWLAVDVVQKYMKDCKILSKELTEAAASQHATVPVCHGLCGNAACCGLLAGFSILVV
jgi:hypothetical protein